jgi:hypothetical protein
MLKAALAKQLRETRLGVEVGEEVVPHCEEGGRGAGGDIDLVVDVLNVITHRLLGDREAARHLAVGQAAREQSQHLDLALAQARGQQVPPRPRAMPSRAQDRIHHVAI